MFASSRFSVPLRRIGVVLLVLMASGVASCAKKGAVVDPNNQPPGFPEGVPSSNQMIVWNDTPSRISLYADNGDAGPSPDDSLMEIMEQYLSGPGSVAGTMLDYTPASGFQVFRKEANGGYHLLKDFVLQPTQRWIQTSSDGVLFFDPRPVSGASRSYIGRGIVEGHIGSQSPLTPLAITVRTSVNRNLNYTGVAQPPDSLFRMSWQPVAGAAGYWVQVYQLSRDVRTDTEIIGSGIAAPLYLEKSHDTFIGFIPAPDTSYHLADPLPAGGRLLIRRTPVNDAIYSVRIAAVDANGELIAYTGESEGIGVFRSETTYRLFVLGAAVVQPKRPPPPERQDPGQIEGTEAGVVFSPAETGVPGLWIYPRASLPQLNKRPGGR